MNKAELIDAIAQKSQMTKKDSSLALQAALDAITDALESGDKVTLVGFGTFETRNRKPRTGLNPRTKEQIMIPGTKSPAFKPGKELKERVL